MNKMATKPFKKAEMDLHPHTRVTGREHVEPSRASQGTFSMQKKIVLRKPLANLPLHLMWPELGQMPIRMGAGEDAEQSQCISWQLGTRPLTTMREMG